MRLFFCKGVHHQFQPVFLIGSAGAGVAVQRKEYGFRISHMELVDHAFSRDVVRQAAEGLEADDAAASMMEKIRHVSGEEPSFAGAVAEREESGGSFGQPRDIGNLVETFGNFDCFFQREDLGMKAKHILAIQGPFSYEMNLAMIRDYKADVMVTKNSGLVGGSDTKLRAAMDAGISVIIIDKTHFSASKS